MRTLSASLDMVTVGLEVLFSTSRNFDPSLMVYIEWKRRTDLRFFLSQSKFERFDWEDLEILL